MQSSVPVTSSSVRACTAIAPAGKLRGSRAFASDRSWIHLGVLFALLVLMAPFPALAGDAADDPSPLVVGLTGKYPPFNFTDASGALVGFDVEFARALCAELERPCEFRILPWDGILAALLAGRLDVIVGSMAITEERAREVTFSRPYYESGAQLFVRNNEVALDAAGTRIGVTLGTTYEQHLRVALPSAEVVTYKGDIEVVQDVQAGRLDGMVTDRLVGAWLIREKGLALAPHGEPLFVEQLGIPTAPGNVALGVQVDAAVARLRAAPTYDALFERWFGTHATASADSGFRLSSILPLLARGLWVTVRMSGLGLLLGAALAIVLAIGMLGGPRPLGSALALTVDLVRSTPFVVQLLALYFGLPAVGIDLGAFQSAVLAIGLHSSAYLSELLKAAYQGVPRGQHQAASTLGLSRMETLRHVVLPQMTPRLTAPVLNTVVAMIKDSAIASVVSVPELTMEAQKVIGATFRPLEIYALAAIMYALITWPLLLLGRAQERKLKERGLLHASGGG